MNAKDIVGLGEDKGLDGSTFTKCETLGCDVLANYGVLKMRSFGVNNYLDNVINITWFINKLQEYTTFLLFTTSTKIPNNVSGWDTIRGKIVELIKIGVRNGFISPSEWFLPDTIGKSKEDFLYAINNNGFFVFRNPQTSEQKENRKFPTFEVAIAYAGSVHSGNIIIQTQEA